MNEIYKNFDEMRKILEKQIEIAPRKSSSGVELKCYIDCRPLVVDHDLCAKIAYNLINLIGNTIGRPLFSSVGAICGATFSGAHLAQAISYINVVPGIVWFAFHSRKNVLIMPKTKIEKCIIIDDVVTTGSTLRKIIEAINKENIKIQGIFVIVDRRKDPTQDILGYNVTSLFKMTEEGELYQ